MTDTKPEEQDELDPDAVAPDTLDPNTEPSVEDLEGLEDLEDDDIEEIDEEDEEDEEEFLDLKEDDGDDEAEDDDTEDGTDEETEEGSLEDELEEDLAALLDERLAEEDIESQESFNGQGSDAEMSCDMCFLLVTASQFGSPKNPRCPSDELECPLLERVRI